MNEQSELLREQSERHACHERDLRLSDLLNSLLRKSSSHGTFLCHRSCPQGGIVNYATFQPYGKYDIIMNNTSLLFKYNKDIMVSIHFMNGGFVPDAKILIRNDYSICNDQKYIHKLIRKYRKIENDSYMGPFVVNDMTDIEQCVVNLHAPSYHVLLTRGSSNEEYMFDGCTNIIYSNRQDVLGFGICHKVLGKSCVILRDRGEVLFHHDEDMYKNIRCMGDKYLPLGKPFLRGV